MKFMKTESVWKQFPIKIYADGPTLAEISELKGKVSGFTFNPTLFRKLGVIDYLKHCYTLVNACDNLNLSLEVISDDYDGMVRQARILNDLGPNVYVKIPITFTSGESTLQVIETLIHDNLRLNITAILSKKQVEHILPVLCKSNSIVSVFAGRLFDIGIDATEATKKIADYTHDNSECKILWASPRMIYDIKNACKANCDIITMLPSLMKKLPLFEKTDERYSLETVKMFYDDAIKSGYKL